MTTQSFDTNLLRLIAAQQWLSLCLQTSRELYGKSYTALSVAEKNALDQMVFGAMALNYQAITPEWLATQKAQQSMGFQVPPVAPMGAHTTGVPQAAGTSPKARKEISK